MSVAESRKETAERVAERFLPYLLRVDRGRKLIDDIEAAFKERDERAAKIVDNRDYERLIPGEVAAAIRNEDTNTDQPYRTD